MVIEFVRGINMHIFKDTADKKTENEENELTFDLGSLPAEIQLKIIEALPVKGYLDIKDLAHLRVISKELRAAVDRVMISADILKILIDNLPQKKLNNFFLTYSKLEPDRLRSELENNPEIFLKAFRKLSKGDSFIGNLFTNICKTAYETSLEKFKTEYSQFKQKQEVYRKAKLKYEEDIKKYKEDLSVYEKHLAEKTQEILQLRKTISSSELDEETTKLNIRKPAEPQAPSDTSPELLGWPNLTREDTLKIICYMLTTTDISKLNYFLMRAAVHYADRDNYKLLELVDDIDLDLQVCTVEIPMDAAAGKFYNLQDFAWGESLEYLQAVREIKDFFKSLEGFAIQQLPYVNLKGFNFSNELFDVSTFQNRHIANLNFQNAKCRNVNFTNTNFKNIDFRDANFCYANFSKATLFNVNLSDADLSLANFSNATLINVDLSDVNFSGANLSGAKFNNVILLGNKLATINLAGAVLTNVTFFAPHSFETPDALDSALTAIYNNIKFIKLPHGVTGALQYELLAEAIAKNIVTVLDTIAAKDSHLAHDLLMKAQAHDLFILTELKKGSLSEKVEDFSKAAGIGRLFSRPEKNAIETLFSNCEKNINTLLSAEKKPL